MLHYDLQFVNAGQGCKRLPYGSHTPEQSHYCRICSPEGIHLFTLSCCCLSVFIICSGLCDCTDRDVGNVCEFWVYIKGALPSVV